MAKNYIQPQINQNAYTCPHCNTLAQMVIRSYHFDEDVERTNYGTQVRSKITIHRCECCRRKIIWVDGIYAYPDIVPEEANPDMPESVKQLYNEAALIAINHLAQLAPCCALQ